MLLASFCLFCELSKTLLCLEGTPKANDRRDMKETLTTYQQVHSALLLLMRPGSYTVSRASLDTHTISP
jgi:hypothetical protein